MIVIIMFDTYFEGRDLRVVHLTHYNIQSIFIYNFATHRK
jgi:mRNA-degrading endonuclease HigB of HigAB toxin-antitoxin module